ncbi:hypothetical protein WEB32_18040 [Streptomyces netropsis]|uniref:hypothetical protein n=1 Tax=Streptomyces netropsis TaxID=55404 RepID=UPI0030CFADA7
MRPTPCRTAVPRRVSSFPGTDWLADCSPTPTMVRKRWADEELADIPAASWAVVEADLMRSIDALQSLGRARRLGPVLVCPEADRAWWLVPHGPDALTLGELPQVTVHKAPWTLRCPPAHEYTHSCGWLEKPDGSGRLTDPVDLGAALGLRHPIDLRELTRKAT